MGRNRYRKADRTKGGETYKRKTTKMMSHYAARMISPSGGRKLNTVSRKKKKKGSGRKHMTGGKNLFEGISLPIARKKFSSRVTA